MSLVKLAALAAAMVLLSGCQSLASLSSMRLWPGRAAPVQAAAPALPAAQAGAQALPVSPAPSRLSCW